MSNLTMSHDELYEAVKTGNEDRVENLLQRPGLIHFSTEFFLVERFALTSSSLTMRMTYFRNAEGADQEVRWKF